MSTSAAAITGSITQQKAAIAATGAAQRAGVRAQIAAARAEAQSATTAAQGQLRSDGAAKSATVTAVESAASARVAADTTTRQEAARAVGTDAAQKTTEQGNEKATGAQTTLQGLADSARSTGTSRAGVTGKDADTTAGKRQAATQLGADTAEGVLGNLSALLGGVTAAVTEAATSLAAKAAEVADELGNHLGPMLTTLGESASAAISGLGDLVGGAVDALSHMIGQLGDKLGELEQTAIHDLDQAVAAKQAELDHSGQDAVAAFHEQGAAAEAAADQQLAEAVAEVGQNELSPEQAASGGAEVAAKITTAFDGIVGKVSYAEGQLTASIQQVGSQAIAALSGFAAAIGDKAREVVGQAKAKTQEHVSLVEVQTATAATRAQTETRGAADAHAEGMDKAVDQTKTEIAAKQAEVSGKIDSQVRSDVAKVRGPVDSLAGRISGAQNEIDNRSAWDSFVNFLSSIGSWLKQQWNDFVEIISDWGFWAGLVVGILASFVLGPIGGAMVGAFVGTIVSNLTAHPPRPWHQNLIKNVVIAGLFTAAIVGAVAAAVYFGAGAVAVFIVVEVVTVIGTIVINAVNGDRWDRGLLANMFIIGLLHLLFAKINASGKGGPPEPEKPPGPPEPEKPPGPPEPEKPPGGQCFVPGTLVHTPEGPVAIETLRAGGRVRVRKETKLLEAEVVRTFVHRVEEIFTLHVGSETLRCSGEHPFWVEGRGWVPARQLAPGDRLRTIAGDLVPLDAVECAGADQIVHNIEVAGHHVYHVGDAGVLVHNKAARASQSLRAENLAADAEKLPGETPGKQEIINEAEAIRAEAQELENQGAPESPELEQRLKALEERVQLAELPVRAEALVADTKALEARANALPMEEPMRWEQIQKAQGLRANAEALRDLVASDPDPALLEEYWRLRREATALRTEIGKLEPAAPPESSVWEQRLAKAKWTDHGGKHMKARSAAEAKEMTTPTDANPKPESQYDPAVNNQALELEALRNGTVIKGDPNTPGSSVHVQYDAGRVVGYDGGNPVTTIRAEITAGDVYHGHPRAF